MSISFAEAEAMDRKRGKKQRASQADEAQAKRNAEIREANRPKDEAWTAFQAATREQHENWIEATNAEGATKQQVQAAWGTYRNGTGEAWDTYLTAIDAYSSPPQIRARA